MQNENNNIICQSCGMPMLVSEHFGTRKGGIPDNEYCCFCFKEGEFTDNLSVYEYATGNVQISKDTINENGLQISSHELILHETVKLQRLKRWNTHIIHQDYYTSVYRVLEYINQNINTFINLDKLSEIANISKYHFHRIFKAMLNESPGEYIQRLKLEKTAFKLHTTKLTLKKIADQVGYQTPESLSKAFKKKYGLNPKEYRQIPSDLASPIDKPVASLSLNPEIKIISEIQLLCAPVKNVFTDKNAFTNAWSFLVDFIDTKNISNSLKGYYCISRDISTHTAPNKCRVYACVEIIKPIKSSGKFSIQKISGGQYAIFKYEGAYSDLDTFYCDIYRYWIPKSQYTLRDSLHFEKFLSDFDIAENNQFPIEIYIPIEKKDIR